MYSPDFQLTHVQEDVEGSKDQPLISSYEGTYIPYYEQCNYDQAEKTIDEIIQSITQESGALEATLHPQR